MIHKRGFQVLLSTVLAGCLSACGGAAEIGGTVTGLGSGLTLTLQNNGAQNVTVTGTAANALNFSFPVMVDAGATYSASVLTQPVGQTCTIANGSGTVDELGSSVDNIAVTCSTTASVTGTVAGLVAGVAVTLRSNGVNIVVANGPFQFPGLLAAGSTYEVTVAGQPAGQTCVIANPTGTVVANTAAVVTVTCN